MKFIIGFTGFICLLVFMTPNNTGFGCDTPVKKSLEVSNG